MALEETPVTIPIRRMLGAAVFATASFAAFVCGAHAQTLQALAAASDDGRQQRLIEGRALPD